MIRYILRLGKRLSTWRIEKSFKQNISRYFVELLEISQSNIHSKEILYYIYQRVSFNINI